MSKFFSKFKGEKQERPDLTSSTNPSTFSSNNPYRQEDPPAYAPPPGPPPSHGGSSSFPPEKHHNPNVSSDDNLPPYHDWTVIPDTALLPPPPAIANEASTTSNASYDEAERAHAWCAQHPVYQPRPPNPNLIEVVRQGRHDLDHQPSFSGLVSKLDRASSPSSFTQNALGAFPVSVYHVTTSPGSTQSQPTHRSRFGLSSSATKMQHRPAEPPGDQYISTLLPLLFAASSSPLSPQRISPTQTPVTIYFEIIPLAYSSKDATVSLGYVAKPYPPGRQPGWHRASLAVHGDDGHRFVNDPWGGRDFTSPFTLHKPIGLAMTFYPEILEADNSTTAAAETVSQREVKSQLPRCKTKVYLVRNGAVEGDWNVDEERDAEMTLEHGGVEGLMGEVDLYAAVGMYGNVDLEVRFYAEDEGFVAPPA